MKTLDDDRHGAAIYRIIYSEQGERRAFWLDATSGNDISGMLFVSSGLGGMSGAQPKAGNIAGVVSVVAEMAKHLTQFGADNYATRTLFGILQGEKPIYNVPSHEFNKTGEVEGRLVGGNMAVRFISQRSRWKRVTSL